MNRILLTISSVVLILVAAAVVAIPSSSKQTDAQTPTTSAVTIERTQFVKTLFANIAPVAECSVLDGCITCCNAASAEYASCRTLKTGGSICECIIRAWRYCGIDCGAGPCSCCDSWERAWNTQRCDGTK